MKAAAVYFSQFKSKQQGKTLLRVNSRAEIERRMAVRRNARAASIEILGEPSPEAIKRAEELAERVKKAKSAAFLSKYKLTTIAS